MSLDREGAAALLEGLVSIRSLSGSEGEASHWLVEQMRSLGYDRAAVDGVGNAVGEIGPREADRVLVLLGHIDTVEGEVPVRRVQQGKQELLYGRGSVDAKGPLAAFVATGARLGAQWAEEHRLRLVVAGAVEEEAATSRGARHLRDRFNGDEEPVPSACVIGEPSQWQRLTLGYKGRLLIDLAAEQSMRHTAGPSPGVTVHAVALWNQIAAYCEKANTGIDKPFDQTLPSLRSIQTTSDGLTERVESTIGLRLSLEFDRQSFWRSLEAWGNAQGLSGNESTGNETTESVLRWSGDGESLKVSCRGFETAFRSGRSNPLVSSFLGAIRSQGGRPGFVVKTGTSDMNVVAPAWQCPILAYGAGDSSLDHTPDEHIDLDEFWQSVLVLEEALRRLGSISDSR